MTNRRRLAAVVVAATSVIATLQLPALAHDGDEGASSWSSEAVSGPGQTTGSRGKRTERVVEVRYAGTTNVEIEGVPGTGSRYCPIDFFNPSNVCIRVPLEGDDRYVKVEFADVSGHKVAASLMHALDGTFTPFGDFCGAHDAPVAIPGTGGHLQIFYAAGTCPDGAPSLPTTGTLIFTFSNKP